MKFFFFFLFSLIGVQSNAQKGYLRERADSLLQVLFPKEAGVALSANEVLYLADQAPPFSVYKDNFFTAGIPLDRKVNKETVDALFQISIRQKLTRSKLLFKSFAFLTYTQKSFWNIIDESSPFYDNNYNPGIGLGRYLIVHNQLMGGVFVQLKHESNGRDSLASRSWNYLSAAGKYYFGRNIAISTELWIPFLIDQENNNDLIDYRGIGVVNFHLRTNNENWRFMSTLNPRRGFMNFNFLLNASYKLLKNSNQYAFAQVSCGYAEGLMDYNVHHFNVRIGVCIKPDFLSIY